MAENIKEIFKKVHKKKGHHKCAATVTNCVWNLYDGKCKPYFAEWLSEIIREKNPYRQAEEIAKVMDLMPGQLNLSGYNELRKGLEAKNKQGLIPRTKGWLCSEF